MSTLPTPAASGVRPHPLDRHGLIWTIFVVLMAIFLAGELLSPYPYTDARFVVAYVVTEVVVALALLSITLTLFVPAEIGLRRPQRSTVGSVWPLLVLVGAVLAAWLVMRLQLPAGTPVDNGLSLRVIRTTLLVGLNEEWIFRGLLLAAFCRWWGLRRGVFSALLAFSAFHLLNLAGGVAPLASLFQFANTFVLGAILLYAALGSRSLLIPMVGHALYDFAVIDMNSLATLTALSPAMAVAPVLGWLLGLWCIYKLWQLRADEPPYGA